MVNISHLKVVLRKDYLILKRRKGFCVALFLIPPILAMLSIMPTLLQNNNPPTYDGSMFWDNYKDSSNIVNKTPSADYFGLPLFNNRTMLLSKCVYMKNDK